MKKYNIKTLVFDLGGVYFTKGTILAIEKIIDMYEIKNKNRHLLRTFFRDGDKNEGNLVRLGLITMDEFEEKLISKFNIADGNHIRNLWFGSYIPNYKMEALINELGKKYRLVVFSGNIRERIEFLEKRYNFTEKFDDFVYSFDYQKNKNDIEFYRELLNHIDCDPSEAILIDDERKSVIYGQSVGLNSIIYFYTDHLINELKKYEIQIDL
ncbi:MAG: hypothetical protein EU529_06465 [Promethearchaeota archaeon]|nr:MAG: hypothetical protein EU529_06465 [Candidatus Lokiarchaeota archaeon]